MRLQQIELGEAKYVPTAGQPAGRYTLSCPAPPLSLEFPNCQAAPIPFGQSSISIVFAANVKYYQHLCVLIVSILENNPLVPFAFCVLTDKEDEEAEKIRSLSKKYQNFDIRFIVVDDTYFENFPLPLKHVTIQMYYRFLIPFLLQERETAFYFDCDMICNADLRELWEIPLDGYYVAGVRDNLCSKQS